MSTDFTVTLTAPDGSTTSVKIIDSLIPLQDSFKADEGAIGNKAGSVTWPSGNCRLHTGPGGAGVVTLEGFTPETEKDNDGPGGKMNTMGSFPDGPFRWRCEKVA